MLNPIPVVLKLLASNALAATESDFYAFGGDGSEPSTDLAELATGALVHDACPRLNDALKSCAGTWDGDASRVKRVAASCAVATAVDDVAAVDVALGKVTWSPTDGFATATDLRKLVEAKCPGAAVTPRTTGDFGQGIKSAAGLGMVLSPASLVGATDFLVGRAQDEILDWSVDRYLRQVCLDTTTLGAVRPAALIPSSCKVLESLRGIGTAQALDMVSAAATADAVSILRHTSEELLRADARGLLRDASAAKPLSAPPAKPLSASSIDLLITSAVLGRYVELVVAGASPVDAMASWARLRGASRPAVDASDAWSSVGLSWADQPVSSLLYSGSMLLAAFPPGTVQLKITAGSLAASRVNLSDAAGTTGEITASVLGNFYARHADAPSGGLTFSAQMNETVSRIQAAVLSSHSTWDAAVAVYTATQAALLGAQGAAKGTTSDQATLQLAISCTDLAGSLVRTATVVANPGSALQDSLLTAQRLVGGAGDALRAISARDSVAAVSSALSLTAEVLRATGLDSSSEGLAVVGTVGRAADFSRAYLGAETPEDARLAIEAVAAQRGGYEKKRRGVRDMYVTLNGYVGVGGGGESLVGPDKDENIVVTGGAAAVWPSVIVGPEVGWRINQTKKSAMSVGAQLQVIDLGTLAMWRIGDSDAEALPDVEVSHVFSPGLNVAVGLPGMPFSILGSLGVTPKLRDIAADDLTITSSEATSLRYGLQLAVDIPILH